MHRHDSPHLDRPFPLAAGVSWGQLADIVAQSRIATDVSLLKQTLRDLQVRVEKSAQRAKVSDVTDSCYVLVHLSLNHVTKESLTCTLGCPVSWFTCIKRQPSISLWVKLPKSSLHTALT